MKTACLFTLTFILTGCARHVPSAPASNLAVTLERRIFAHTKQLWKLTFTPDSRVPATGSTEGAVNLCRAADGVLTRTTQPPKGVGGVAASPDGQTLPTAGYDGIIRR